LHHLWNDKECRAYVLGERFKREFGELIEHDRLQFKEPTGWQTRPLSASPLLNNFEMVWTELLPVYHNELSELAYASIPQSHEIVGSMREILGVF